MSLGMIWNQVMLILLTVAVAIMIGLCWRNRKAMMMGHMYQHQLPSRHDSLQCQTLLLVPHVPSTQTLTYLPSPGCHQVSPRATTPTPSIYYLLLWQTGTPQGNHLQPLRPLLQRNAPHAFHRLRPRGYARRCDGGRLPYQWRRCGCQSMVRRGLVECEGEQWRGLYDDIVGHYLGGE